MKKAEAIVKIVTPCIMSGSNQASAQIRAPSIRGNLRWWFRIRGGKSITEGRIFGRIGGNNSGAVKAAASNVVVRVDGDGLEIAESQTAKQIIGNNYDYFLWPLSRPQSARGLIKPGGTFKLMVTHRGLEEGDFLGEDVLKTFLLFGTMGTRHRRAYGSIYPEKLFIDEEEYSIPDCEEELATEAGKLLKNIKIRILKIDQGSRDWKKAISTCAEFLKTFRAGKDGFGVTPSEWGKHDHDLPFNQDNYIFRPILGLPYSQSYRNNRDNNFSLSLKQDGRQCDRWESPVIFKIVPLQGLYTPLALIFPDRALPPGTELSVKRNRAMPGTLKLQDDLLTAIIDPPPGYWNKSTILFSTI